MKQHPTVTETIDALTMATNLVARHSAAFDKAKQQIVDYEEWWETQRKSLYAALEAADMELKAALEVLAAVEKYQKQVGVVL